MNLLGRHQELTKLQKALTGRSLVSIAGPSGVGKSAVARAVFDQFEGERAWIECEGLGAHAAASAFLETDTFSSIEDAWEAALDKLRFKHVKLVVLDGVGFLPEIAPMLQGFDGAVLATVIEAPDEGVTLPLQPLDPSASAATELFIQAAQAESLAFEVGNESEKLQEIVERVAGFPLGLVLAGRRAAVTSIPTVLGLLKAQKFADIGGDKDHHGSLLSAVAFTWNDLSEECQELLYAMSMFRRPLKFETVATFLERSESDVLRTVRTLVRSALLPAGQFQTPGELIRDFAMAHYPAEGARTLEERALANALTSARTLNIWEDLQLGDDPSFWELAVFDHLAEFEAKDADLLLQAWCHFIRLRVRRNAREEMARVKDLMLEFGGYKANFAAARALEIDAGEEASAYAKRAAAVAETKEEEFDAIVQETRGLLRLGNHRKASETLDRAIAMGMRTHHSTVVEATVAQITGDEERFKRAAAMYDPSKDRDPESRAAWASVQAFESGDYDTIAARMHEINEMTRERGNTRELGYSMMGWGLMQTLEFGDLEGSLATFDEAEAILTSAYAARPLYKLYGHKAMALLHTGHFDEVIELLDALDSEVLNDPTFRLRPSHVAALWQLGRLDDARRLWAQHRETCLADTVHVTRALNRLLDLVLCDPEERRERLEASVAELRKFEPYFRAAVGCLDPPRDWTGAISQLTLTHGLERSADLGAGQVILQTDRRSAPLVARLRALEEVDADIVVTQDFHCALVDGTWTDLTSQGIGRSLLRGLHESNAPLDHGELGELLYPGEFVEYQSMENRINVQVSKLRKLGFKPFIVKEPEGFVLAATLVVESE